MNKDTAFAAIIILLMLCFTIGVSFEQYNIAQVAISCNATGGAWDGKACIKEKS
jgi:hypothetical protein